MNHKMFKMSFAYIGFASIAFFAAPANSQETSFNAQAAMGVIDLIIDNHIDSPTRQEMVLRGVKALRPGDFELNSRLGKQVSQLGTKDELMDFLEVQLGEWSGQNETLESAKRAFINGVFQAVPGGGELFDAEVARINNQLQANQYVGVGIALTMTNDVPMITKCFFHGPGYKAGVRDNDFIIEIDGKPTEGKSLRLIVDELRGPRGSDVQIVVKQKAGQARDLAVTRDVTFIPTVEGTAEISPGQWSYILQSWPKIAYLKVVRISPSTVRELKEIHAELLDSKLQGIVLDVRGGGGTLHDTLMVADQFLDEGTIGQMVTLSGTDVHKSRAGSLFADVPVAVLVNQRSGAGNAYLAAAIQDRNRGVVVGAVPQGGLMVKSQLSLPDGSQVQFATGILKRANGKFLSRVRAMQPEAVRVLSNGEPTSGLHPDIAVPSSPAEVHRTLDSDPCVVSAVQALMKSSKVQ